MSNSDWQSALQGLLDSGSLPAGQERQVPDSQLPVQKGRLVVSYEKKGRGGKQVTIISGFNLPADDLADVAASLKRKLGVGGSARGGEILIQGDCRAKLPQLLRDMGFKV